MKILTEEQVTGHNDAIFRGAAEGLLGTAAFAIPASFLLNRRWTYYRSLPLSLKVLGAVMVIAPLTSIQAERRGLEFDREVNWYVAVDPQALPVICSTHRLGRVLGEWSSTVLQRKSTLGGVHCP